LSHQNLPSDGASCHALGVVGKFSLNKGVSSWFHNVSIFNDEVIETIFSLKTHLNKIYIMEFGHTLGIVKKLSMHRI
jgi:hypothetical protein